MLIEREDRIDPCRSFPPTNHVPAGGVEPSKHLGGAFPSMRETARPRHFLQVRSVLCRGMQDTGSSKRVAGGRSDGVRDGQPEPGVAEEDRPRLQL